jgi:hypothetical protein
MLRAEEGDEIDAGGAQDVDPTDSAPIHAGLVGHEPDPETANQVRTVGDQDLEPRTHDRERYHRAR